MTEVAIVAGVFVAVLLFYVWWDTRRAERRWRERHWTGSCLRDRGKNKAFDKK